MCCPDAGDTSEFELEVELDVKSSKPEFGGDAC